MIYILLAAATTLLAACADRSKNKNSRIALAALWVLLFCIVAGARNDSVGVDVLVYGYNTFDTAMEKDLVAFLGSFYGVKDGAGCALYFWCASRLTNDFNLFLAAVQLACALPYCLGAYKVGKSKTWLFVLFYGLYIFPLSLCLMKQMIACSICFLAYSFARDRRLFPYLLCIAIAVSFHLSAIVAVIFYPLLNEFRREVIGSEYLWRSGRLVITLLLVGGLALLFLFREDVLLLFSYVKASYSAQLNSIEDADFVFAPLIMLIPMAGVAFVRKRGVTTGVTSDVANQADRALEVSLFYIVLYGFVMCEMSVVSPQLTRLSHYFLMYIPIYCAQIIGDDNRGAYLIMASVFCYFVLTTLVQGIGGVVPYTSAFFGIGD